MMSRFLVLGVLALSAALPVQGKLVRNNADTFGYLQFWNVCPPGTPSITGTLSGGTREGNEPINAIEAGFIGSYTALQPGSYTLELHAGTQTLPPLKLNLDRMRWFTVLVRPDSTGKITAQIIDDTYAYKATDPGTIIVYNFTRKGQIACGASGAPPQPLGGFGAATPFSGFVGPTGQINAVLTSPDAKRPRNVQIPLPLDQCKRWAIIFLENARGRIGPKVCALGYNAAEFKEFSEVPDDYPDPGTPNSPSGSPPAPSAP